MLVCIKCPLRWGLAYGCGGVKPWGCGVGHIDGVEGFLRVFVVFVYLIRVFSGLLLGWVGFENRPRIAVLKRTRTEVCCKTAEHAKMLVSTLKAKARMIMKQGKG